MGGRLMEGPTMVGRTSDWKTELGQFLKPFLDRLGHKARRQMCPLYAPAAEGRTRSRSLRGSILARPASSCVNDDDRLRLPPASPARNRKTGKKESTGHRLNRPYPPCVRPSSNSSPGRNDARTAENGFATGSGVSNTKLR